MFFVAFVVHSSSVVVFDLRVSACAFCVLRKTEEVEEIKVYGTQPKTERQLGLGSTS